MSRVCVQMVTVLAMVVAGGAASAEPGIPLGSAFAEQGAVVHAPVVFAPRAGEAEQTRTATGTFEVGARDWSYVPVDVPAGVREIAVSYSYDRPVVAEGTRGNTLDIGIFDESGIGLGDARGFRGWSGGSRTSFSISASGATPAYVPGPVRAGRWHIVLGPYTVAPQELHWTVSVTVRFGAPGPAFVPNYAPERAAGRGDAWYRGDMHLHSVYSDGRHTPEQIAAEARQAGLDFMVSTEHNNPSAHAVWGAFAGPDLLIMNGEEVTTRNGHYLAVGLDPGQWIDWRYRSVDDALAEFVDRVHRVGGLAVAAHPYATCLACLWKSGYDKVDAVEVWNNTWDLADEAALATWDNLLVANPSNPRWVPAVGDSDSHGSDEDAVGVAQTVVHARRLERSAIMDGIRRGHVWVTDSKAVDLAFTVAASGRTVGIGDRLAVGDAQKVSVSLRVSGAPGAVVRFVTDEGVAFQALVPASGAGTVTWTTTPQVSRYVRAEVRRVSPDPDVPAGMIAFTNPIFLGR